jgi:hypothetical protein
MPAWLQTGLILSYEWLRDWQVLVAAALVIWTLRACSCDFRQSLRMIANAERKPEPRAGAHSAPETSVEPLLVQTPGSDSKGATVAASMQEVTTQGDLISRLETLRNAVRHALAEIPATGGEIGDERAKLYRKVMSISLDGISLDKHFDQSSNFLLQELRSALTEPRTEPIEAMDGRTAWEWLVRVNRLARNLHAAAKAHKPLDTIWRATN